jgi:hypothetical protein
LDWPCEHCEQPDTSLLRVVLIGEIVRADEATLYTLAGVCEALGMIQFSDEEEDGDPPKTRKRTRGKLRRVK